MDCSYTSRGVTADEGSFQLPNVSLNPELEQGDHRGVTASEGSSQFQNIFLNPEPKFDFYVLHRCSIKDLDKPSPPNFDFKTEFFSASWDAIQETHPELLDLTDDETLFLIKKSQCGSIPPWRSEFDRSPYG
ncbi:hypothetical protein RND71_040422 [Anisodus tanguticus]|uniref:Uncharacterized protein n=1 Tax=Anisodus tanguticus TaxID=243964 RepID=A0AAE1QSJ9_9SOLA|nr:hypothetical protein RND71_040422 [Anisodus tanguticus]